jgi:superfamily I DNA/RNA helicase
MHKWLSEDYRAKKQNDITANSVTISTIHSVKGLDFACVFLLGLDALNPDDRWKEEQINCLAYVGITRARYRLTIPYLEKTPLIERIERAIGG